MKKSKNAVIEAMRFLFASAVIFFHMSGEYNVKQVLFTLSVWKVKFFRQGNLGVEFFFLTSGLFLAHTCYKQLSRPETSLSIGEETMGFLFRKVKTIMPFYLPACAFYIIGHIFLGDDLKYFVRRIPSLLLLHRTGIHKYNFIGVAWYICSMLIACSIVYPLCRKYYKTFTALIAPVGSLLIIGALIMNYGSLGSVTVWSGITYKCNFRALAEVAMGTVCYEVARRLKEMQLSYKQRLLLSVSAFMSLAAVMMVICSAASTEYGGIVLLMIAYTLTIVYSRVGVLGESKIYASKLFCFLGSLSLPMYLLHKVIFAYTRKLLPDMSLKTYLPLLYLEIILISYAMTLAVNWGKKRYAARRNVSV